MWEKGRGDVGGGGETVQRKVRLNVGVFGGGVSLISCEGY